MNDAGQLPLQGFETLLCVLVPRIHRTQFRHFLAKRKEFLRDVQPIYQDPFEVYNPFYKAEHLLFAAVSKFELADSKEEGRELIAEALDETCPAVIAPS